MIKVIHGQLYSEDFSKLEQLAADYSSCVRWCYVKFNQEPREFNNIRNLAKEKYTTLNTRQISDAVIIQGQALAKRNKKLLQSLKAGLATKKQWKDARDGQIYARGDKTKTGNPNLRVVGDQLRVTVGNRKFENYKLFVPEKFQLQLADLLVGGEAYNVRLKKQDEKHWHVLIDYEVETPIPKIGFVGGAIGVDTNVDRIATRLRRMATILTPKHWLSQGYNTVVQRSDYIILLVWLSKSFGLPKTRKRELCLRT